MLDFANSNPKLIIIKTKIKRISKISTTIAWYIAIICLKKDIAFKNVRKR